MNRIRTFMAAALLGLFAMPASGETIKLAWDENHEPQVTSYHLFYGELGSAPTKLISPENSATVPELVPGRTYFFYVTAVTELGIESAPSEQIVYTVPMEEFGSASLKAPARSSNGAMLLQCAGQPGRTYAIQAANTLNNPQWTTIDEVKADVAGLITAEDFESQSMRFYRTVQID